MKKFGQQMNIPQSRPDNWDDARKQADFLKWCLGETNEFPFFKDLPVVKLPRL